MGEPDAHSVNANPITSEKIGAKVSENVFVISGIHVSNKYEPAGFSVFSHKFDIDAPMLEKAFDTGSFIDSNAPPHDVNVGKKFVWM